MKRSALVAYERNLARQGGPVDKSEWGMNPQQVNAYYNPPLNEIVFPAAILQPPFFNLQADDAVNYGAIGAVIGHEIAHAELRHSVKKLSRGVGRQAIIIAGAAAAGASFGVFIAVEVGNKILGLGLGRDQERMADKYSVKYLGSGTNYSSDALAGFFEELVSSGKDARIPPILSTHPDTENRIKKIRKWAKKYKYSTEYQAHPEFKILQNSIPK